MELLFSPGERTRECGSRMGVDEECGEGRGGSITALGGSPTHPDQSVTHAHYGTYRFGGAWERMEGVSENTDGGIAAYDWDPCA